MLHSLKGFPSQKGVNECTLSFIGHLGRQCHQFATVNPSFTSTKFLGSSSFPVKMRWLPMSLELPSDAIATGTYPEPGFEPGSATNGKTLTRESPAGAWDGPFPPWAGKCPPDRKVTTTTCGSGHWMHADGNRLQHKYDYQHTIMRMTMIFSDIIWLNYYDNLTTMIAAPVNTRSHQSSYL